MHVQACAQMTSVVIIIVYISGKVNMLVMLRTYESKKQVVYAYLITTVI